MNSVMSYDLKGHIVLCCINLSNPLGFSPIVCYIIALEMVYIYDNSPFNPHSTYLFKIMCTFSEFLYIAEVR